VRGPITRYSCRESFGLTLKVLLVMNLIVAIFVYLGLSSSPESVITQNQIELHRQEIEETQRDPLFHQFWEEHTCADGIFVMDTEACE
jgi:hypothetical protein